MLEGLIVKRYCIIIVDESYDIYDIWNDPMSVIAIEKNLALSAI